MKRAPRIAGALAAALTLIGTERVTFGTYVVDNFAVLFKVFFLTTALVVLALSLRYFQEGRYYQGEYYFLLLSSFLGMITMPSSRDLLMLFISLELVSAPGFLMAGLRKRDPRSNEAALKFFLIGILSTAVMLYGMSLIYGVTGSLQLSRIAEVLGGAQAAAHAAVGDEPDGLGGPFAQVPVDGVLQPGGERVVVLGGDDDERVGGLDAGRDAVLDLLDLGGELPAQAREVQRQRVVGQVDDVDLGVGVLLGLAGDPVAHLVAETVVAHAPDHDGDPSRSLARQDSRVRPLHGAVGALVVIGAALAQTLIHVLRLRADGSDGELRFRSAAFLVLDEDLERVFTGHQC